MTENTPSIHRKRWGIWALPRFIWWFTVLWIWFKHLFHIYLCYRQDKVFEERRSVPRELRKKISPEIFEQARAYRKHINSFEIFSRIYWIVLKTGQKIVNINAQFWLWSAPLLDFAGLWFDFLDFDTNETIAFAIIVVLYNSFTRVLLKLYRHFVIEEKYGFNKLTLTNFFIDFCKETLLEVVVTVVVACAILAIVKISGQFFFIWVWLFCFLGLMISLALYPNVIAPLFDKYTHLRQGRLRDRLQTLANSVGFPLDGILVLHQSWRSKHSDAYFISLLRSKRIVLYDTLLEGYPEADLESDSEESDGDDAISNTSRSRTPSLSAANSALEEVVRRAKKKKVDSTNEARPRPAFTEFEIQAIVAREIGHWVLGHSVLEIILPELNLFLFFAVLALVYEHSALYEAFGFPVDMEKPIILGLKLLYDDVLDIYKWAADWYLKYLSRQWELEADQFAVKLGFGKDLKDAIIALNKENLKYPFVDQWFMASTYDFPIALERLHAIDAELNKKKRS